MKTTSSANSFPKVWDDLGKVTLSTGFDYDSVDRNVFNVNADESDFVASTCELQSRVFSWQYQSPCKDLDGFLCRSIIVSWVFVPELRSYSMTDIAGRFGKKKQSLGRWVDDFKKEFPEVANHLQHIRNE